VGLISFSSEAETLVQPTTDRDLVRQQIAGLHSSGGTAIGAALQQALDDVRASPATVLLFSDGANSVAPDPEVPPPRPLPAASPYRPSPSAPPRGC
jgi:Mg-chelatase subunit ChlD